PAFRPLSSLEILRSRLGAERRTQFLASVTFDSHRLPTAQHHGLPNRLRGHRHRLLRRDHQRGAGGLLPQAQLRGQICREVAPPVRSRQLRDHHHRGVLRDSRPRAQAGVHGEGADQPREVLRRDGRRQDHHRGPGHDRRAEGGDRPAGAHRAGAVRKRARHCPLHEVRAGREVRPGLARDRRPVPVRLLLHARGRPPVPLLRGAECHPGVEDAGLLISAPPCCPRTD
uniref:TrfA protein n=1 Tax=Macrostomum lignano TaxID=282301 RepID=A0A1I8HNB0_9PLAT